MNFKDVPQYVVDFIDVNKHLECSLEDFFLSHSNESQIHNHTIENLFLYFDLSKHLDKDRVVFYPGAIFLVDNRKYKFFIFDDETFLSTLTINIPFEFRKKFIFYSSTPQKYVMKTQFEESKLHEYVYDLEKVFDKQTFIDKYQERGMKTVNKKYYNRVTYPFKYLEKLGDDFQVQDVTEEHLEEMERVHKEWTTFKLNDPKVFQMMFSSGRYNRTIRAIFNHSFMDRKDFFCKVFYYAGKPVAFRQCLVIGECSYDIGFFSTFWNLPSQLVLYINSWCLKELKDSYGVKFHNCGLKLDRYLTMSKEHFPGKTKLTYSYKLK